MLDIGITKYITIHERYSKLNNLSYYTDIWANAY